MTVSRQSPQPSQGKQPIEDEQAQGQSRPRGVVFIVTGQDLAANGALFESVDGSEHFGQSVGVGRGEGASARELGQVLQKR